MLSLPSLTWYRFLGWLGFGLIIYANYGYHRSRTMKRQKEALAQEAAGTYTVAEENQRT